MRVASAVWLAVIVLLSPAAQAQEDRDAAFKAGLEARQDRRWQDTAAQMRRAIQANPREDTRKVTRGFGRLVGAGGTEYLPHYFLGEALYNLGECERAVESWSESMLQGAVKARAEYVALLQKGYAVCKDKGVLPPDQFDPLLTRMRQQITDVTNQAGAISARGQAHIMIWRADASLREQYDKATGELQSAQSHLVTAQRTRSERDFTDSGAAADRARGILNTLADRLDASISDAKSLNGLVTEVEQALQAGQEQDRLIDSKKAFLTPTLATTRQGANETLSRARSQLAVGQRASSMAILNEARTLALDASARFKSVLDEVAKLEKRLLDARLTEALTGAQEAISLVESVFRTLDTRLATKPATATPDMMTQRAGLQKQFDAVQRRLESARKASNVAGIEQATRLAADVRVQLETIITAFGPMTIGDRGVRPELAEGARLFFAGDYEQALAALDPTRLGGGLFQEHVHLFRAAAHYALYVRSGERDQSHRTQSLAEIEQCKRLNPAFQPAARAFGPRFISFFQNANAPAAAGATPPS